MKTALEVDKPTLQVCIKEAEKNGPLVNRAELWTKVAELYNQKLKPKKPLSGSVVYLRVTQWNLSVITPRGKKGRAKGSPGFAGAGRGVRVPKAIKFAKNPLIMASIESLRKTTPERFLPLIDAIKNGSRAACVKLKCLQCSNWMTPEIRQCVVQNCALYPVRPYQGKAEMEEEGGLVEIAADSSDE